VYWLAVAVGIALLAALITRGNPFRVLRLPYQGVWMLVVGLGVQIALEFVEFSADRRDDLGFGLLMGSYTLLLAFSFVNLRVRGIWLVAIGLTMSTVVVGLNEGMPTRDREVEPRRGREVERPVERTVTERPESDDDVLPILSQRIPLPENRVDHALAPGDLVIAAGLVLVFALGSRRPRRRARRRGTRSGRAAPVATRRAPVGPPEPRWSAFPAARLRASHSPPRAVAQVEPDPEPRDQWDAWKQELRALAGELNDEHEQ
jgi:Family of unknown function (DUF5317)